MYSLSESSASSAESDEESEEFRSRRRFGSDPLSDSHKAIGSCVRLCDEEAIGSRVRLRDGSTASVLAFFDRSGVSLPVCCPEELAEAEEAVAAAADKASVLTLVRSRLNKSSLDERRSKTKFLSKVPSEQIYTGGGECAGEADHFLGVAWPFDCSNVEYLPAALEIYKQNKKHRTTRPASDRQRLRDTYSWGATKACSRSTVTLSSEAPC